MVGNATDVSQPSDFCNVSLLEPTRLPVTRVIRKITFDDCNDEYKRGVGDADGAHVLWEIAARYSASANDVSLRVCANRQR